MLPLVSVCFRRYILPFLVNGMRTYSKITIRKIHGVIFLQLMSVSLFIFVYFEKPIVVLFVFKNI